jgi:hypothetical protein
MGLRPMAVGALTAAVTFGIGRLFGARVVVGHGGAAHYLLVCRR